MLFFEMRIQIFKEKLFGLLQSPPAGGRLIGEGFACSHGCIFLSRFRVRYLHKTQIHPLPTLLHNNSYATFCDSAAIFGLGCEWRSGMLSGYGRLCRCDAALVRRVLPGGRFCHAGLGRDDSQAAVTRRAVPDLLVHLLPVHLLGNRYRSFGCAGGQTSNAGRTARITGAHSSGPGQEERGTVER